MTDNANIAKEIVSDIRVKNNHDFYFNQKNWEVLEDFDLHIYKCLEDFTNFCEKNECFLTEKQLPSCFRKKSDIELMLFNFTSNASEDSFTKSAELYKGVYSRKTEKAKTTVEKKGKGSEVIVGDDFYSALRKLDKILESKTTIQDLIREQITKDKLAAETQEEVGTPMEDTKAQRKAETKAKREKERTEWQAQKDKEKAEKEKLKSEEAEKDRVAAIMKRWEGDLQFLGKVSNKLLTLGKTPNGIFLHDHPKGNHGLYLGNFKNGKMTINGYDENGSYEMTVMRMKEPSFPKWESVKVYHASEYTKYTHYNTPSVTISGISISIKVTNYSTDTSSSTIFQMKPYEVNPWNDGFVMLGDYEDYWEEQYQKSMALQIKENNLNGELALEEFPEELQNILQFAEKEYFRLYNEKKNRIAQEKQQAEREQNERDEEEARKKREAAQNAKNDALDIL